MKTIITLRKKQKRQKANTTEVLLLNHKNLLDYRNKCVVVMFKEVGFEHVKCFKQKEISKLLASF